METTVKDKMPETFLELLRDCNDADDDGRRLVSQDLVDYLVALTDEELTTWLLKYRKKTAGVGAELRRMTESFSTTSHFLHLAIEATVMDRWIEENA